MGSVFGHLLQGGQHCGSLLVGDVSTKQPFWDSHGGEGEQESTERTEEVRRIR